MKYVSLKNILKKFLVCAVVTTSLSASALKVKIQENEKVEVEENEIVKVKTSEIEEAHAILKTFKKTISAFFDKKNNELYKAHVNKFGKIVVAIKNLTCKIEEQYNKTKSEKYKQLLNVLNEIKENVLDIYNALTRKHKNILSLAFSLGKIIRKYTTSTKIAELENKLNNLRKHLNQEEAIALKSFISTLYSIDEDIPKSKIACLSRLNRVWKKK